MVLVSPKSLIWIVLVIALIVVTSTQGNPSRRRREFLKNLQNCAGIAQRMCFKLSSYCHPRILKRSLTSQTSTSLIGSLLLNRSKRRSSTRHFRFNCKICKTYCWN